MDLKINITYQGRVVGSAEIRPQGLYQSFICRCCLPAGQLFRLKAIYEDCTVPLGVCIPTSSGHEINTRIPSKKLGRGRPVIEVISGDAGRFIPLNPCQPADFLTRLPDARLAHRDGIPGIMIIEGPR